MRLKRRKKESREEFLRQEYSLWLAKMPKEIPEEKAIAYDALVLLNEPNLRIIKDEFPLNRAEKEITFLVYKENDLHTPCFLFSIILRGETIAQYKVGSPEDYFAILERTIDLFPDDVTIITSKRIPGNLISYSAYPNTYVSFEKTNRYKNNQLITSEEKRYNRIVRRAFMDQDNILVKQQIAGRNTVQGNYITSSQFDKRYKGALKRTRKK